VRNHRWFPTAVVLLLLLAQGLDCSVLFAQQRSPIDPLIFELLRMQEGFRNYHQERMEYERRREQERLRVPAYNIQLSQTVAQFHHHIRDMHYRHENCKLCRRYTRQIKQLANRIDSVMK